jgi:hypothetical protein
MTKPSRAAWVQPVVRAAWWIPGGALFGFLCALPALTIAAFGDGHPRSQDAAALEGVLTIAMTHGGVLGAIQLPIAALTILPAENRRAAMALIAMWTIAAGAVAAIIGRADLSGVVASIAFWSACAADYRARDYDRYRAAYPGAPLFVPPDERDDPG